MPFTLLVPIIGVLSAALFLDEPLTWRVLLGGAATIAGVAVIVLRRPRLADPEATSKTV
jgi:O-acetylserine/cysteine efflux transporter